MALLIFTSVGWRVPFHIQMPLQAAKVALLVVFGTRPYCDSKVTWSRPMLSTTLTYMPKNSTLACCSLFFTVPVQS